MNVIVKMETSKKGVPYFTQINIKVIIESRQRLYKSKLKLLNLNKIIPNPKKGNQCNNKFPSVMKQEINSTIKNIVKKIKGDLLKNNKYRRARKI